MQISINLGPLDDGSIGDRVSAKPASKDNLGEYTLQITSCLTYGDQTAKACADGAPFTITVVDPCSDTTIAAEIFPDVMSKP